MRGALLSCAAPEEWERRASDWVRQIRRVETTPEKATAEPAEAPASARKAQPKRRGLVQKLRRLLKRSAAFARMNRHRSDGLADQAALSVRAERCERQAGALMVLGRAPDLGQVQVLLATGGGHPAVTPGDRLLLHRPWSVTICSTGSGQ
ncbi:uncharacterized protein LOC119090014 [Pollicipes pollicipes]|uniref:uncharacterized protein LOC119090014 n=1 Tax=Pollicipes pollicipes TaxID=41117 RepID=UPI0018854B4D|nr:uncharacterized protein LOC119090014 [Pollicipes pollicipes]